MRHQPFQIERAYTIYMIGDTEFATLEKAEAEADYLIEEEGREAVEIDEVQVESDESFNGTGYWNLIQTITICASPTSPKALASMI